MFTNSLTSTPTVTMRDTHRGNSHQKKGEKTTFFLSCGSGIRCLFDPGDPECYFRISDPGSQTHIAKRLVTIFWVKSTIILCEMAKKNFFTCSKIKNKIIFSFVIFGTPKKGWTTNFSPFSFVAVVWSGIRDRGSGMDENWIREKHPGSATLHFSQFPQ